MEMIFLYQTRGDRCLEQAIRCLTRFVDRSRVVLIGDKKYVPTGKFFHVSQFSQDFSTLDNKYIHRTPNEAWYEKECIRRWFCALRVMDEIGCDKAFFMDSDCLLCCDPFKTQYNDTSDMSLGSHTGNPDTIQSAGISFQTRKSLREFMDFTFNQFFNGPHNEYGSSDMGIWTALSRSGRVSWSQLGEIKDGCAWDFNISSTDLYLHGPGGPGSEKPIIYHRGLPYSFLKDGNPVRLLSIHFWAHFKERMKDYNDSMEASMNWKGFGG